MSDESKYQLAYPGEEIDEILKSANEILPNVSTRLGNLENNVEIKAQRHVFNVDIPASDEWNTENGVYSYTVPVEGLTDQATPHIVPRGFSPSSYNALISAWNCITCAYAIDDGIVFYCYDEAPSMPFSVQIEYFN